MIGVRNPSIPDCVNSVSGRGCVSSAIICAYPARTATSPAFRMRDKGRVTMKIALGADHAGFELKERVKKLLLERKHEVIDLGAGGTEPVDYPDFAEAVGLAVRDGKAR